MFAGNTPAGTRWPGETDGRIAGYVCETAEHKRISIAIAVLHSHLA